MGKILCGISAGAICWFDNGISDSVIRDELRPLKCLGFIPGTICPHYDEAGRREAYHRYLESDEVTDGYGIDNGVALHLKGAELVKVVASREHVYAYRVYRADGGVRETVMDTVFLRK